MCYYVTESDQMENYINRQASEDKIAIDTATRNKLTRSHKSIEMTIIARVVSVGIFTPGFHQLSGFALGQRHDDAIVIHRTE